jgi:hypothetical protein
MDKQFLPIARFHCGSGAFVEQFVLAGLPWGFGPFFAKQAFL